MWVNSFSTEHWNLPSPKNRTILDSPVPQQQHSNELTFILCRFVLLKFLFTFVPSQGQRNHNELFMTTKTFPTLINHSHTNSTSPRTLWTLETFFFNMRGINLHSGRYQLIPLYHRHTEWPLQQRQKRSVKKKTDHVMKLLEPGICYRAD